MADIPVCRCGSPLVFTFEFRGYEYVCVDCGHKYGVLGVARRDVTPELAAAHAYAQDRYDVEAHQRDPDRYPLESRDFSHLPKPTCVGCGRTATDDDGRLDQDGKPPGWRSRTVDGVETYACSIDCTRGSKALVTPW